MWKYANKALWLACEYIKEINEKTLPISFNVFWLHIKNANQASGKFIFAKKLNGYLYQPIVGFHYIEKTHKCKRKMVN